MTKPSDISPEVQRFDVLLHNLASACSQALANGDPAECDRTAVRQSRYIYERLAKAADRLGVQETRRIIDQVWENNLELGTVRKFFANRKNCTAFLPIMLDRALSVADKAGEGDKLETILQGVLDVYWQCETTSADMLGADGIPFEEKPHPEQHKRAWQFREWLRGLKLRNLARKRQCGEKIRVIFLVHRPAIWQYEGVYRLMEKDPAFEPLVVVAPFIPTEKEVRAHNADLCKERFGEGYNVRFFFDNFNYDALLEQCNPDMAFFTDSWGHVCSSYCAVSAFNCLVCYSPYGFHSANMQGSQYNRMFHHFLDYMFCESPLHVQMAQRYADNQGKNAVASGYPKLDALRDITMPDPWGANHDAKRIIWAPHFTIMENRHIQGYSCFLEMAASMLDLARRFSRHLQFAFKPHPNLKGVLYDHPHWGPERTEEYWRAWAEEIPGAIVAETDYMALFLHSDAMILDSISFISEYMVTGKPMLFTIRDKSIREKWNEYGLQTFNLCYHAEDLEQDVSAFLSDIILEKKDDLYEQRIAFVKENLVPAGNKSASENIYELLLREITVA